MHIISVGDNVWLDLVRNLTVEFVLVFVIVLEYPTATEDVFLLKYVDLKGDKFHFGMI